MAVDVHVVEFLHHVEKSVQTTSDKLCREM